MILGCNNRESVAMAAILNKKISSAGIFGDFSPGCLVGIQVTFLKISAFYIFFRVEPYAPGLLTNENPKNARVDSLVLLGPSTVMVKSAFRVPEWHLES